MEEVLEGVLGELRLIDEVKAVYLFGSHARESSGPLSDIDICVVTPRELKGETRERILGNASKRVDVSLFWDLPPAIRMRVIREGRLLYETDPLLNHRARVATVKQYLDFNPIYTRHVLRALT
jgi:predicted nucleotidyltransferase